MIALGKLKNLIVLEEETLDMLFPRAGLCYYAPFVDIMFTRYSVRPVNPQYYSNLFIASCDTNIEDNDFAVIYELKPLLFKGLPREVTWSYIIDGKPAGEFVFSLDV